MERLSSVHSIIDSLGVNQGKLKVDVNESVDTNDANKEVNEDGQRTKYFTIISDSLKGMIKLVEVKNLKDNEDIFIQFFDDYAKDIAEVAAYSAEPVDDDELIITYEMDKSNADKIGNFLSAYKSALQGLDITYRELGVECVCIDGLYHTLAVTPSISFDGSLIVRISIDN